MQYDKLIPRCGNGRLRAVRLVRDSGTPTGFSVRGGGYASCRPSIAPLAVILGQRSRHWPSITAKKAVISRQRQDIDPMLD